MATQRIESGQITLRGPGGGVPMQQITPRAVDYIGFRAEAQASNSLSQIVDRMSQSAFQMAGEMVKERALTDVANSPLSLEQLEVAKKGDMSQLGIPGSTFNIYDATLRKARSFELASAFDTEAKAEVVKILSDIEVGSTTSEKAAERLNTLTKGYSQSLAKVDGDAALKFTASMGSYANTVMAEAYKVEQKRNKELRSIKALTNYENTMKLVGIDLARGYFVDKDGVEQPIEFKLDQYRESVASSGFSAGGAALYKEYYDKFAVDLKDKKIQAAMKVVLGDEYMDNPNQGVQRILTGDFGRFSPVWAKMDEGDKKKVRDDFFAAVDARKKGIEANLYKSEAEGDAILRSLYSSRDVNVQRELFKQVMVMPISPEKIKTARSFIDDQSNAGRPTDDLVAYGRLAQRVALGMATDAEIISGPFTNATKRELMKAKANPTDDINYAVNQINLSVGIQSANLPPELKAPEARQLAVQTRNELVMQLSQFARTPDEKGLLPTPAMVRKQGDELASKAKASMSGAFSKVASANQSSAVLMLPELKGVDLNNEQAVSDAFAKATARKANRSSIDAANNAVQEFRVNSKKANEGQK